jgi:DNA-binding winged helix-turn-helix (wHTH) protein
MRFSIQEVEIGPFLVDLTTGRILRDGIELALRPQAFRVLKTLIQNSGQYVDFERMIAEAWDGTMVSRHTVDVTVGEVKKLFQEFGSWIAHRAKLGYRLEVPKSEDLVRKGWHFWNRRTREGFEKAIASFREAAAEDGTDFRAYEGLAASYVMFGTYGMRPPSEIYPLFLDALSRAVALTGWTPELRAHRAHGLHIVERKFEESEAEFLQARREKPSVTRIYGHLALLYVAMARFDEALDVLNQGYKIDPLWPVLPATEVSVRFFSRDFESAVECGKKAVELHPYITVGRCFYAQALEYSGRIEDALREYRIASVMSPGMVWLRLLEGACLAGNGRSSQAAEILEDVLKVRATEYVDAYYMSLLYGSLGMRELAFRELERAYDENSVPLCLLDVDAKMDALRQDPQFETLRKNRFGQINLWDSSQKLTAQA